MRAFRALLIACALILSVLIFNLLSACTPCAQWETRVVSYQKCASWSGNHCSYYTTDTKTVDHCVRREGAAGSPTTPSQTAVDSAENRKKVLAVRQHRNLPNLDQLWASLHEQFFKDVKKVSSWTRPPIGDSLEIKAILQEGEHGDFCTDDFDRSEHGYCVKVVIWRETPGLSARKALDRMPQAEQNYRAKIGWKPIIFLPERTANHGDKIVSHDPYVQHPTWTGLESWTVIGPYFTSVGLIVHRNDGARTQWLIKTAPLILDAVIEFLAAHP